MPQMSGFELHEWIGANRPDLIEHLLFITGDTMDQQTQQFIRREDIHALSKPFEVPDFYRLIRDLTTS